MRWILLGFLLMTGAAQAEPQRILAVGDSLLAWQKWTGRDIPSVMGQVLGAEVENDAVAGARFSNASGLGRALGFDVRSQYRRGPWDLVLMNGGANDLLNDCSCGACGPVVDGLIDAELDGEVPRFIAQVLRDGAQVLWMGYYASARSGQFAGCRPYLVEYDARIARLAAATPGLTFVDSEDALDPDNRALFAVDGIHPSPEGAQRVGLYLANRISP
ncbi:SGNH/GDSL hydrolase family protein [uncultured Tateyamaria sp.]|uniref:SGNH/GDSL hydrolase family protein n=1 Tax=Tateyamaria sp. 1078 TaxID=3417464 RepID=UPI0026350EE9|nr:SGNH/GDSL hydrolase family protein [uncultured Tateyamaria sp.]